MDITHRIYKKFGMRIAWMFHYNGVTANQVTIVNFLIMIICGCNLFASGDYRLALIICTINVFFDYLDGDLARIEKKTGLSGWWLDVIGDAILLNAIMASIGISCVNNGMSLYWLCVFFVSNASMHIVSFHYNETFGFDSYNGSETFRKYMDVKPHFINRAFKNIIDPTSSWIGLCLFTVRYWIVFGAIFNCMNLCFMAITILTVFRSIFMYILYFLHLQEYKKLWLLQALAIIDQEREEYYALRCSEEV